MADITQIQVGSTTYDIRDINTYTKSEVNAALSTKADLVSPSFTGSPTAPTPSASDDSTRIATTAMVQDVAETKADIIISSASGSVASFADGADDMPVTGLTVDIEPVQDLHGYSNPWPAGGGKNKLKSILYNTTVIANAGLTLSNIIYGSDGYLQSVTVNGTTSAEVNIQFSRRNSSTYTTELPVGDYIFSVGATLPDGAKIEVGKNATTHDTTTSFKRIAQSTTDGLSFSITDPDYLTIQVNAVYGTVFSNVTLKPMVRLATESDATYAPYENICPISGHTEANIYREAEYDADADPTVTIDLNGTIYKGTLNILTGEMTVTHKIITLDGVTSGLKFDVKGSNVEFDNYRVPINDADSNGLTALWSGTNIGESKCSIAKFDVYQNFTSHFCYSFYVGSNSILQFRLVFPLSYGIDTLAKANSYIKNLYDNNTPCQLVYKLATPITVQLTPSTLETLKRDNAIWCDTGNTSVKYWTLPSQDLADAIQGQLDTKADASDVYSKSDVDTALSGKSDTGHTHTMADVTDLPTLGNLAEQDTVDWDTDIDDIPSEFPPEAHTHTMSDITDLPTFGTLAEQNTVDYDTDIDNLPTLGALASKDTVDWDTDIDDIPSVFPPDTHTHTTSDITDFPTLGTMSAENTTDYYNKSATDALLQDKADIILSSASGALVHITDGGAYPVESLNIAIELIQSGSGNPSPDNIRNISGWSEVNIYHEDEYDADADPKLTINLGGTRYSCSLNVLTGELTVERVCFTYDGNSDENWSIANTGTANWYYQIQTAYNSYATGSQLCNKYPIANILNSNTTQGTYITAAGYCRVRWGTEDSVSNWKSSLSSLPMQIVGKLTNPLTIQLDPETLSTLLGENYIWSDAGDTSLSYRADTKLYIETLTKPTEDDMVANDNISSGVYFMVGANKLFISTSAIARGSVIKPGTNCTALSLADALNSLS